MIAGPLAWVLGFVAACALSMPGVSPTDARINAALDELAATPSTVELRAVLAERHVRIWFAPLALDDYADFIPMFNGIEINPALKEVEPVTLASVLAHEAVHAQGKGPTCIDEELHAFRASALFWRDRFGPAGKSTPHGDVEEQMNAVTILQSYNSSVLETHIRKTYANAHHCPG
jgi:hypothetical protein